MHHSIKDFLCKESQDLISIHDYHPSGQSVKYKAKRNGLPVILQISPVPDNIDIHADLRNYALCQGVLENDATKECKFEDIFIEAVGDDIVYRSRDCQLLVTANSERCDACVLMVARGAKLEINETDLQQDNCQDEPFEVEDYSEPKTEEKPTLIEFKKVEKGEKKEKTVKLKSKFKGKQRKLQRGMKRPTERLKEECPFCHKMFDSVQMQNHVTSFHLSEKDNPLFNKFLAGIKPYVCDGCGERFYNKSNLSTHMRNEHPDLAERINTFQCDLCDRNYAEYKYLLDHKETFHDDMCESVLCNSCGKEFRNKRLLNKHIRRVHNKRFECTECGKSFSYKQELTIHVKMVHLGVFDISCSTCGKGFSNKKLMECHVKEKHEQIKPLHCEMCVYRTFRVGNLNLHRSKNHQLAYITKNEYKIMVEAGQNPFCDKIDYDAFRYAI